MDRGELRVRTLQGLRWLEAELRELVDIARFRSEAEQRLFRIQLKRIRCQISEFEGDLVDLLTCYPEPQHTDPLKHFLAERTLMKLARPCAPHTACDPSRSD